MAFRVHIVESANCASVEFFGAVKPALVIDVLEQLVATPGFEPGMNLLYYGGDRRTHGGYHASKAVYPRLKALYGQLGVGKVAMVAADPTSYALLRQVELIAADDRPEKRAFESMAEARTWLDIPYDVDIG